MDTHGSGGTCMDAHGSGDTCMDIHMVVRVRVWTLIGGGGGGPDVTCRILKTALSHVIVTRNRYPNVGVQCSGKVSVPDYLPSNV